VHCLWAGSVIRPLSVEQQRSSPEFFEVLNFNLCLSPIHPSEQALMARFGRLGIGPNGSFKAASLTPELRAAVQAGMADAWKQFEAFKKTDLDTGKRTAAEGFGTREFLKNDYLVRMASITLQFGGCDGSVTNCLPITPGWNDMVRLYRPQQPVLKRSWRFPVAEPLK
jgi:hypothetical protein